MILTAACSSEDDGACDAAALTTMWTRRRWSGYAFRLAPFPTAFGENSHRLRWSVVGIEGEGLVVFFAVKGVFITIADFSEERGAQAATHAQKIKAKFHPNLKHPSVIFVHIDV